MHFKSKKGILEFGLNWIMQILILLIILWATVSVSQGMNTGELMADSNARSLGRMIEVSFLTSHNTTVSARCPSGLFYNISLEDGGAKIIAAQDTLISSYAGEYYFMRPYFLTQLNENEDEFVEIDCSAYSEIIINKGTEIDPDDGSLSLKFEVYGNV